MIHLTCNPRAQTTITFTTLLALYCRGEKEGEVGYDPEGRPILTTSSISSSPTWLDYLPRGVEGSRRGHPHTPSGEEGGVQEARVEDDYSGKL
jgi:hypothetical protein